MMKNVEKKRVLLVDDEAGVRIAVAMLLQALGADVVQAGDGHRALELVREKPFDAVLTDFHMPGMKGDALAEAIRSIQPDQHIILITGYVEQALQRPLVPLHVNEVLAKPCSMKRLAQALRIDRKLLPEHCSI
jgi:CheY-like chemotaxis protein